MLLIVSSVNKALRREPGFCGQSWEEVADSQDRIDTRRLCGRLRNKDSICGIGDIVELGKIVNRYFTPTTASND